MLYCLWPVVLIAGCQKIHAMTVYIHTFLAQQFSISQLSYTSGAALEVQQLNYELLICGMEC